MAENALNDIDLSAEALLQVQQVIQKHLTGKTVWAYGSRVKGRAGPFSDLDLVVFEASEDALEAAKEAFVESDLPFSVDLLAWQRLPLDFQQNIARVYVVLQGGGTF